MCIAFMSISENPEQDGYKVIIAVNRDEFYNRPTKELDWWDDNPDVISGARNYDHFFHPGQFFSTVV